MRGRALSLRLALLAWGGFVLLACGERAVHRDLILATTTSTQDSGLLDVLIPVFQARSGYRVKPVAVGTGEALAMGGRGDVDVLLTHAPALELELVEAGQAVRRRRVMHNDFLIAGPPGDPAGVSGLSRASEALARIAEAGAVFVSRGDRSGTHFRERAFWKQVGIEPGGESYLETGQGMAATLLVASARGGYVLTDRGTHLALTERSELVVLVEGDPELLNVYSVMEVNPERFGHLHHAAARAFSDFLLGEAAQSIIRSFGVERFGEPLFFPRSGDMADGGPVSDDPADGEREG